jgi:hypothetical protein
MGSWVLKSNFMAEDKWNYEFSIDELQTGFTTRVAGKRLD